MPGTEPPPGPAVGTQHDVAAAHAPAPETTPGVAGLVGRVWGLSLWWHTLVFAALLAAVAPFLHLHDTFTSDEGAYAIQAQALDEGHWEYPYEAERYDPDGRWFPLHNAGIGERGWFAYVQHPAYPVALVVAMRLFGEVIGLHLFALLGAVGVAVAAWLLAAEVDHRLSRPAFWLAASGPVAINAYLIWAHASAAAVAGFTLVAAVWLSRDADGPSRPVGLRASWLACVVLVGAAVTGVLLRSEGLLFAWAVAGGLLLVGLRGWPLMQRLALPGLCALAAGATTIAEQRWITAILGSAAPFRGLRDRTEADAPVEPGGGGLPDWIRGRAEGVWHSLLQGAHDERLEVLLVTVALVLVTYAAWTFRRRRPSWERDVTVALGGAAALYAVRMLTDQTEAMTGLLAAWPLALLGVALLRLPVERVTRLLVCVVGLFGLAIVASQYRGGGGLEWGGRFFAPALAPLAVLACLGLRRLAGELWPRHRAAVVALALLAVLPSLTGLLTVARTRDAGGEAIDEFTTGGRQLVVTHTVALPRAAWRTYPEVAWMLVPPDEISEVTARLRAGGARQVTMVVPETTSPADMAAFPSVADVSGPAVRRLAWRTFELTAP